ncbi:response regulator transcription factor [Paenibacillus sp. OK003]|uniref:response regulator transcription factor n=1 Tax=Paenibacillus sp. OK003 TaxID=1884380 RepID=UPI0008ABCC8F|nr:response regulator transcription factor [Paenibacillus sp. OK003]SEL62229.1 DNA-binding response regulator, OmpR family, contains REC and winged-helix (wHTH) domain [Paenibacillus sp. OK003]
MSLKNTILIVDDDHEINELLTMSLKREGFQTVSAYTGVEALRAAQEHSPDLVLLDVLLPGMDGFQICSEIRKTSNVPILFVSCKDEATDKVIGLGLGGDDFISKPFSPIELIARVKAHIRRNNMPQKQEEQMDETLVFDQLLIDPATHRVLVGDKPIALSAKEFKLLFHLAKNPNRVYKNEQLFSLLWDDVHMGDTHTVMVHIYNLRKKLEKNPAKPQYIRTIRGVGYKFNDKSIELAE